MSRRLRAAACVVVVVVIAVGCGGGMGEDGAEALRVLYLGNSLTAANDLPSVVASIVQESGATRIGYETVAPGGVSLEDHWRAAGTRALVRSGGWDVVVLQQGPSTLPGSRIHLRRWSRRWSELIRSNRAQPALLGVWAEAEPPAALDAAIESHVDAARASGALLLPVAAAWSALRAQEPQVELYGDDGFHPSELGTAVAALVVAARMDGIPPEELSQPDAVPEELWASVLAAIGDALELTS